MSAKRCGKTLVEVLVLISVTSVILATATTTLVTLFRIERQISRDLFQGQTIARLASRLRSDAHEALAASADGGCELTMADGRKISYSFAAPRIVREVRRGDTTLHRDSFVLPKGAEIAFTAEKRAGSQFVRLSIALADSSSRSFATPVRGTTIDAAINLHSQPALVEAAP